MNTKLEVYFPIDSVVSSLAIVEDGTTRARVKRQCCNFMDR